MERGARFLPGQGLTGTHGTRIEILIIGVDEEANMTMAIGVTLAK